MPACCSNWIAASGQSVTQVAASGSCMPAKAFCPMRADGSKPSTFMA